VSGRNKLFAAIKTTPRWQQLFAGDAAAIHPALGPEPTDIVVTKHRVGAFPGTDLEMILRSNDIETLVLFGIATSGWCCRRSRRHSIATIGLPSLASVALIGIRRCTRVLFSGSFPPGAR